MRQSHRLYVGTIGEGLWRSRDGGETFVRAMDGMFVECHVRALAEHPREPGRSDRFADIPIICATCRIHARPSIGARWSPRPNR